jgi:hypothetical protein
VQQTCQSGVVRDFDAPLLRNEARTQVKTERPRMVERAGDRSCTC